MSNTKIEIGSLDVELRQKVPNPLVLNVPAHHEQILTSEGNTYFQLPNNSFETRQVDGQVPTVIHCQSLNVSCLTIRIYVGFCVFAMNIRFPTRLINLIQTIWLIMEQYGIHLDWKPRRGAIDRGV